jgi:hypothetical protein
MFFYEFFLSYIHEKDFVVKVPSSGEIISEEEKIRLGLTLFSKNFFRRFLEENDTILEKVTINNSATHN